MIIEHMKEKEKSQEEIRAKQTQLEQLQIKFRKDQEFMQKQKTMLEEQMRNLNAEKAKFMQ